jgi:Ca2+-binding EF-hand superfamily protein
MTISSYSSIGMMSPVSNISKDIISKSDTNSDSSLSIDELGVSEDQFSTLDSNGDSLVTQDEIASAIDSKLASYNGEMPSKEDFASMLSDLGLEMPEPPESKQSSASGEDFSSLIMSQYDSDGDSLLSSSEVSVLSDEEFSALDTDSDGSISSDELSSAFDEVASLSSSGQTQSSSASGGGSSGSSIVQDEEYDELDTNKDGIVSQEEKNAALGISTDDETSTSSVSSSEDTKDSIKLLLNTIKLNSQNSSEDLDLSNFKNIMKMVNNQSNNSDLNTYVSNLSTSTSSKFSYA